MIISSQLAANCQKTSERTIWLESLPVLLEELTDRWSLRVGPPFDPSGTCSWVAPVIRRDHAPAVLKLAMPHMEGEHEIEGLRFWNGNPTVKLIEADDQGGAMLLERCQPGTSLRSEPEASQDEVIAGMLKRIRSANSQSRGLQQFRHLSEMLEVWQRGTLAQKQNWPDAGLVHRGLVDLREAIAAVPDKHPARNGPPRRQRPARRERAVAQFGLMRATQSRSRSRLGCASPRIVPIP